MAWGYVKPGLHVPLGLFYGMCWEGPGGGWQQVWGPGGQGGGPSQGAPGQPALSCGRGRASLPSLPSQEGPLSGCRRSGTERLT